MSRRNPKPAGGAITYFVQEGGPGGAIKIGTTSQWSEKRIAALQTGNSQDLTLLCYINGGKGTESDMHSRFSHLRIPKRREWFRSAPELLSFIDDVKKGIERGRATRSRLEAEATRRRMEERVAYESAIPAATAQTLEGARSVLAAIFGPTAAPPGEIAFIPRRRP